MLHSSPHRQSRTMSTPSGEILKDQTETHLTNLSSSSLPGSPAIKRDNFAHVLSDFVAVVRAALQKIVDSSGGFEGFVLGFAADAEDGHVLHGLRQLDYRLTLS